MKNDCFVCKRIKDIKDHKNIYFVRELKTGYVVLCDFQLFKGYTIFLSKIHKSELHELDTVFKLEFLTEMSLVAEAVYKSFKPKKLNYELLGNTDNHIHWHLIPRYGDDPDPRMPIWTLGKKMLGRPSEPELQKLKTKLIRQLEKIIS